MNILELASAFPYPQGVIPASIGGTGDKKNFAKTLARHANYLNTKKIYPDVHPYPPTLSTSSTYSAGVSSGYSASFNGQQLYQASTALSSSGSNTLTMDTTFGILIRPGMAVSHLALDKTNAVPAGTTVVSVTGASHNIVTLSNNLTANVASGDFFGFGASVVNNLGMYPRGNYQYTGQYYYANGSNYAGLQPPFAIEFDHYGTELDVVFYDNESVGGETPLFWVWIDGQPATAAPSYPAGYAHAFGNRGNLVIKFDNAGDNTARWRRIRVYMKGAWIGNIKIAATGQIAASRTSYPKIMWLGDSWTEGKIGTGYATSYLSGIAQMATSLLGWGVPYMAGQGGTGYVNDGGGGSLAPFGDSNRVSRVAAVNPDVLMIMGSTNDNSSSAATIQANAYALYSTLQAQLPQTKILVVGPQSRGVNNDVANSYTNCAAVKAAAQAAGLPFLDMLNEGWITGAGIYGTTTGVGNGDLFMGADNVHLQQAGCEYVARRIAAWIADQA